jgi:hypothetical protein
MWIALGSSSHGRHFYRSGTGSQSASCVELTHGIRGRRNHQGRRTAVRPRRPNNSEGLLFHFFCIQPLLRTFDEQSDCTFLAFSIASLSGPDRLLPSMSSSYTTSNVQFQTDIAPALAVSTVLRRKSTLLRGISSVETPSCIYSRLVDGASKGPITAGPRCIISSTGSACASELPGLPSSSIPTLQLVVPEPAVESLSNADDRPRTPACRDLNDVYQFSASLPSPTINHTPTLRRSLNPILRCLDFIQATTFRLSTTMWIPTHLQTKIFHMARPS